MTQPDDATIDQPDPKILHEQVTVPPSDSAVAIAGILDGYMADLQAGKAPDRDRLLAAHPELAAQLEACLAGIEFVHRATGPTADEPAALGEFRILRELGRGGIGVVYEAEQTSLHRRVALKVLRFGVGADEEAMQRFRREAEIVALLHHTNIVPIFAVGSERGVHDYAMQLIEGRSLADVLEESRRATKPLAAESVARWGLQAAEALAHAHQRGVIHRDIKPSNLLIDGDQVVWLTDFGLARRADEVTMTASGALMGTPRYMSPEQAESLHRSIDHRTDLYSLGALLYELATGRPVFSSSTGIGAAIAHRSALADPRWMRPLPWNESSLAWGILAVGALAFVNVVVPLAILMLATRRRVWGVRLLLALPVVVAIPMVEFLVVRSENPAGSFGISSWQIMLGLTMATLAGLPVLEYVGATGQSIIRRRWRPHAQKGRLCDQGVGHRAKYHPSALETVRGADRPDRPDLGGGRGLLVVARHEGDAGNRAL